jgi:DNA polymerase-1
MTFFADIETDGLKPTKIHVMVVKNNSNIYYLYNEKDYKDFIKEKNPKLWVFHNGLEYDVPVLNRLWNADINYKNVIDTFVVSRTINYPGFNTHSLDELGKSLGVYKSSFSGDWSVFTPEMVDYCKQDVEVTEAVFNNYKKNIYDPAWKDALRLEHDTAWLCREMSDNGFAFSKKDATELLSEITDDMELLEASFRSAVGKVLKEQKRLKHRIKKDGSLYDNILVAIAEADRVELVDGEYIIYNYEPFNPGSPQQRIDVLWEHGWQPYEMTKGYKKWLRENK